MIGALHDYLVYLWNERSLVAILAGIMCGISVAYFIAADRSASISRRLVTSAHGAVAAAINLGAWFIFEQRYLFRHLQSNLDATYLLSLLILVGGLIVISLAAYRGPKLIHLLQIPNFLCIWVGLLAFAFRYG